MPIELWGDAPIAGGGARSEPQGGTYAQAICGARAGVGGIGDGDHRNIGRRVRLHDHVVEAGQTRIDLASIH